MAKIRFIFSFCFLFFTGSNILAQEIFIVEGDTLQLKREVKGPISLFWTEEGNDFRYFVQKKNTLQELHNDELEDGTKKFQVQLKKLTSDTDIKVHDVKFVLYSLKHFVNQYNTLVQDDYAYNASTDNIQKRIGFFTGISNNKYTNNPENVIAPVLGLEFEIYDPNLAPRHSAFLHLRQSFEQDNYNYVSTQLSVNYRFKLFYFDGFNVHVDAELANLYYSRSEMEIEAENGEIIGVKDERGFSFTAPLSFGIGSDIRVTENGFITFSYNDIVSLVLDGNGNFPVDFTLGYKYSL
ncbi:MAG TPA: hypothetical protein VFM59_04760 [Salinimicrobium sp.]|nr:hypothetical protein [Salinimicrobium sp.]